MRQLSTKDQMTQKLTTIGHHIASNVFFLLMIKYDFVNFMVNKKKYFCEKITGMVFIIRNRIR